MKLNSFISNFQEKSNKIQIYISPIILFLVGMAFLLSDLRYRGFSFADFIFIPLFLYLVFSAQVRIFEKQKKILLILIFVLITNIFFNSQLNQEASYNILLSQSIKMFFYAVMTIGLFNYFKKYDLTESFLKLNKCLAIIGVFIGIYITVALYTDGALPYEFFWKFTRSHPTSYEFQGNPAIIRTRSLFSEPAHFGFYLNVILASSLFNVQKFKEKAYVLVILIFGVLSTLSYSMIALTVVILGMSITQNVRESRIKWSSNNWFFVILTLIIMIVFWDFFYATLFERTIRIISGEDSSTINRIFNSWEYVGQNSLIFGNGVGHTPTITNNFAYVLSDFGLIGFIPFIVFTLYIIFINWTFGVVFTLLNVSRGGYLGPAFWIVLLFFFLYSLKDINCHIKNEIGDN